MNKRSIPAMIAICVGVILILGSVFLLLGQEIRNHTQLEDASVLVSEFYTRIPRVTDMAPIERGNNTMAAMQINSKDVIGVLSIPAFHAEFPVLATWKTVLGPYLPTRYTGSIYDKSLVIGACDATGQFDFAEQIQLRDKLQLTDTEGGRYSYEVVSVDRSEYADYETLTDDEAALIIFVKDTMAMEYIIIKCRSV